MSSSVESCRPMTACSAEGLRSPGSASVLEFEVISLFDELRTRLLRYTLARGLSAADSEDIVQEAFLSLFRHLQQGKPRSNLRGWLFRVSHNLGLKRISENSRNHELMASDVAETDHHIDQGFNPEEHVAFSEKRTRLLAVLGALPDADRKCLLLRAEGLRYREIAEVLGISLGSVAASLSRSLDRLGRASER